jgi:hypothetical protein
LLRDWDCLYFLVGSCSRYDCIIEMKWGTIEPNKGSYQLDAAWVLNHLFTVFFFSLVAHAWDFVLTNKFSLGII